MTPCRRLTNLAAGAQAAGAVFAWSLYNSVTSGASSRAACWQQPRPAAHTSGVRSVQRARAPAAVNPPQRTPTHAGEALSSSYAGAAAPPAPTPAAYERVHDPFHYTPPRADLHGSDVPAMATPSQQQPAAQAAAVQHDLV